MNRRLALLLLAALVVSAAPGRTLAAAVPGDSSGSPGSVGRANPDAGKAPAPELKTSQVSINLSNVTLDALVKYIVQMKKKPVLLPDAFPGDRRLQIVAGKGADIPSDKQMALFIRALRSLRYGMLETPDYIVIFAEGAAPGVELTPAEKESGLEGEGLMLRVVKVKHAEAAKLIEVLGALKSPAGVIQAYPEANLLLVRDYAGNLRSIMELLNRLDLPGGAERPVICRVTNTSVESLQPIIASYLRTVGESGDATTKAHLKGFLAQPLPANKSFLLCGSPDIVQLVKDLIAQMDVAPDPSSSTYHTYHALNRDVKQLVEILKGVLAAEKTGAGAGAEPAPGIMADEEKNAVLVICTQEKYAEMERYLQELDQPKPQVLIEAALVDMSTTKLRDIGLELASTDLPGDGPRGFYATTFGLSTLSTSGRTPIPPPNGGLTAGVFKGTAFNIPLLIELSAQNNDVTLINAPRLVASDNTEATVEIKEEREYSTSFVNPQGLTSEVTSGGYHDASTTLKFTPHINEAGTIRLKIMVQTDEFLPDTQTANGPLTNKNSRKAETEVQVEDGGLVVIAGLTRNQDTTTIQKVPLLGDIPILGFLFRRTTTDKEQRNLCVFITPRIWTTAAGSAPEAKYRKEQLKHVSETSQQTLDEHVLDQVTGQRPPPLAKTAGTRP